MLLGLALMPPAKEIGSIGYRTGLSTKSQELWDFAQKKSKKVFLVLAQIYLATTLPLYYLLREKIAIEKLGVIIVVLFIFISLLGLVWIETNLAKYDRALQLKKKQENENNS
ncbi:MAG: SdpI family protein [Chitinophagales bacterium]